MRCTIRTPSRADAEAITRVVQAHNRAAYGEPDFSRDDLIADWNWPRFSLERDAWVACTAEGEIVAYARVSDRSPHVDYDGSITVHPDHAGVGLEEELLVRIEERAREQLPLAPAGAQVALHVPSGHGLASEEKPLVAAGYRPIRHFFRMGIVLDGAPPAPRWPAGIRVKTCERGRDEAVFHAVLNEAFEDHFRHVSLPSREWIQRHTAYDFYRPELWYLALENDRPVGAVSNFVYEDVGWVDELGVLESWRGRGLGRALLQQSFAGFWHAGRPRVGLGVDGENATGATRLYESAGMHVVHRFDLYQKILSTPMRT